MALIANLSSPAEPLPEADFKIVFSSAQRFPVPISVTANLLDVENDDVPINDPEYVFANPNVFASAFTQEGTHTEPTIGQIWPR